MTCCPLDQDSFRQFCQLFLQHSNHIRDGWTWEEPPDSDHGYLRKAVLRSVDITSSQDQDGSSLALEDDTPSGTAGVKQLRSAVEDLHHDDEEEEEEEEGDEGVCVGLQSSEAVLHYEYHVLYSCSYGTPVLYFRASTLAGRSLSLEEVWSRVHPNYRRRLQQNPWDTITQQEHPLLGQPFFALHPCKTEEFMLPVLLAAREEQRQVNYVVTWLSVVGPVVGVDLPLSYSAVPSEALGHEAQGHEAPGD